MTGGQPQRPVGRGGAGNFTESQSPTLTPADLQTPAIRSETYTTGRGGAGNMQNSDAANARRAQDVIAMPRRQSNSTPIGRGGAGNIVRSSKDAVPEHAVDDDSPRNSGEHSRSRSILDKFINKIQSSDKKDKKEKVDKKGVPGSPPAP